MINTPRINRMREAASCLRRKKLIPQAAKRNGKASAPTPKSIRQPVDTICVTQAFPGAITAMNNAIAMTTNMIPKTSERICGPRIGCLPAACLPTACLLAAGLLAAALLDELVLPDLPEVVRLDLPLPVLLLPVLPEPPDFFALKIPPAVIMPYLESFAAYCT
jgi:hypothetical protein